MKKYFLKAHYLIQMLNLFMFCDIIQDEIMFEVSEYEKIGLFSHDYWNDCP